MIRKTILMGSMAVAAIAFAGPSSAPAEFTDGTAKVQANPTVTFVGPMSFTGIVGGTSCAQATAQAQITGGQSNAHITSFSVDEPQKCTTQGALAFCTLTEVTIDNGPWPAHASKVDIQLTEVEFQYHYHGGFCPSPEIQLHGSLTLTIAEGERHAIKKGQLEGTLAATSKKTGEGGSSLGNVTVAGTWNITPSGTYGIGEATVALAQFTDGTAEVQTSPNVTFEGPAAFSGGLGGTSCAQSTAQAQLTGSQSNAHVNSFSVDNPNGCTTQGALAFCQLQTVTTEGMPWSAHATKEDIQITKVEFQNHYSGGFCPTPTLQLHGDITIVPDAGQTHALHQGKLQGMLQGTSCKTGAGSCNLGTVTASGTGTVTPAKTYGIGTPTVSPARWTDGTLTLSTGVNPNLIFAGPFGFSSGTGSLNCTQTTTTAQITGGQSNAHITSFVADNPNGCTAQGTLAFCQLQAVTFDGTSWPAHTDSTDIQITNVEFQLHFSGGSCSNPTIQFHGSITAHIAESERHTIKQLQVTGDLTGTTKKTGEGGASLGVYAFNGTWSILPSSTYGIT